MKKIAKIKKDDISEKLLDIKKDSETQENSPNPHIEDSQNEESKIKAEEQVPDLDDFKTLLDTILSEKDISKLRKVLSEHLLRIMDRHQISKSYEVLFLYDNQKSITEDTADIIYEAIPQQNKKPILLILQSKGGQIEPAYLISKTCKERAARFIVAIPRKAKSAATLISLGADEIHMGSMSELGPIDPQFGGLPALGLASSLESLAKVVTKHPKSSEMFASFLAQKLDLRILGYFERVSESAMQYAIRLLSGKSLPVNIEDVAKKLVYEYKDHSFVIDKDEAVKYLGDILKINTSEYKLANELHQFMSRLNIVAGIFRKKNVGIIGSYKGLEISDKEENK